MFLLSELLSFQTISKNQLDLYLLLNSLWKKYIYGIWLELPLCFSMCLKSVTLK